MERIAVVALYCAVPATELHGKQETGLGLYPFVALCKTVFAGVGKESDKRQSESEILLCNPLVKTYAILDYHALNDHTRGATFPKLWQRLADIIKRSSACFWVKGSNVLGATGSLHLADAVRNEIVRLNLSGGCEAVADALYEAVKPIEIEVKLSADRLARSGLVLGKAETFLSNELVAELHRAWVHMSKVAAVLQAQIEVEGLEGALKSYGVDPDAYKQIVNDCPLMSEEFINTTRYIYWRAKRFVFDVVAQDIYTMSGSEKKRKALAALLGCLNDAGPDVSNEKVDAEQSDSGSGQQLEHEVQASPSEVSAPDAAETGASLWDLIGSGVKHSEVDHAMGDIAGSEPLVTPSPVEEKVTEGDWLSVDWDSSGAEPEVSGWEPDDVKYAMALMHMGLVSFLGSILRLSEYKAFSSRNAFDSGVYELFRDVMNEFGIVCHLFHHMSFNKLILYPQIFGVAQAALFQEDPVLRKFAEREAAEILRVVAKKSVECALQHLAELNESVACLYLAYSATVEYRVASLEKTKADLSGIRKVVDRYGLEPEVPIDDVEKWCSRLTNMITTTCDQISDNVLAHYEILTGKHFSAGDLDDIGSVLPPYRDELFVAITSSIVSVLSKVSEGSDGLNQLLLSEKIIRGKGLAGWFYDAVLEDCRDEDARKVVQVLKDNFGVHVFGVPVLQFFS